MTGIKYARELSERQEKADADDKAFFQQHADRITRIRDPWRFGTVTECSGEFWSLGPHEIDRRAILVFRVSPAHPSYAQYPNHLLKIPLLKFADETIEDRDDILLPIIQELMQGQARRELADFTRKR